VCRLILQETTQLEWKRLHSYLFLHKALFFTGQIFVTVVLKCGITLNVKYPLCFWSWLQSKFMASKFLLSMSWQVPDCVLVWEAQHFTQIIIWGQGWKFTQIAKWQEAIWLNVAAHTSKVETVQTLSTNIL